MISKLTLAVTGLALRAYLSLCSGVTLFRSRRRTRRDALRKIKMADHQRRKIKYDQTLQAYLKRTSDQESLVKQESPVSPSRLTSIAELSYQE